jgi:excinuclease ABC subunit B
MAKSPAKNTRPDGSEFDGFEEAPQPKFSGAPVSSAGSIADWAADLAKEAELDAVKARRKAENREIRSAAGKHRKKAGKSPAEAEKAEAEKLKPATSRRPLPISWPAPTRTSATRCCSASPVRARPSPWQR